MTRRQQWCVVIGFLAVIYSVPLTQSIVEIIRGQSPRVFDVFRHVPDRSGLRAYEKELEEQSIFARSVRPWIQYTRFALFGDAGDKVLVGRNGWLFYRPDVRYLVEPLISYGWRELRRSVQRYNTLLETAPHTRHSTRGSPNAREAEPVR